MINATHEQFGTSTPLYHRHHYNSRGQLLDVRLGTDSNAINDGPNPAQWTGASWNRGALRMFFIRKLLFALSRRWYYLTEEL